MEITVALVVATIPFYHATRWIMRKVLPNKIMKSKAVKIAAPSRADEEEDEYEGATLFGGEWKK